MPAFGAPVCHQLFFHTVLIRQAHRVDPVQLVFPAIGAPAFLAHGIERYAAAEQGEAYDEKQQHGNETVIVLAARTACRHAPVEHTAHGCHAGQHTPIPLAFGEIGIHVFGLDALAQSIGQYTFQTVAGGELHTSVAGGEQHHKPVVGLLLAHAPRPAQIERKGETVAVGHSRHHHYRHFYRGGVFEQGQHTVEPHGRFVRQYPLRVGDVHPSVAEAHIGHVFHAVYVCRRCSRNLHQDEKQQK